MNAPGRAEMSGPSSEREIIKTLRFIQAQIIERSKPKIRRRSPIYRKCEDLMEELWECGYHKEIPLKVLKTFVQMVCGGFRSTVWDYLGRPAKCYRRPGLLGVPKTSRKIGYLEKFGFISMKSPTRMILHHEIVDRPYHWYQSDMVNFSLSNSVDSNERREGAIAPIDTDYTTTTYKKRERNQSRESIPGLSETELRILKSARGKGSG